MRYVAAYLLCVLGGKEKPSKDDIKSVLTAVGADCDDEKLGKLIEQLGSKNIDEVLKEGEEKLSKLGPVSGGAGGSAGGAGGATEAAAEPEPEEEEEEEEDLGGGGLFGGSDDDDDW